MAGHGVERRAVLEPLDLGLVEGVAQLNIVGLAILGVDTEGHGLADSELSAHQVNRVGGLDLVVVGGVGEGQRKHTLLLQVGLVLVRVSHTACLIHGARKLTIRAKLRVMMARPPR